MDKDRRPLCYNICRWRYCYLDFSMDGLLCVLRPVVYPERNVRVCYGVFGAADHTPGGANTMYPRRRPYGTLMLCSGKSTVSYLYWTTGSIHRGGGRHRHPFYL